MAHPLNKTYTDDASIFYFFTGLYQISLCGGVWFNSPGIHHWFLIFPFFMFFLMAFWSTVLFITEKYFLTDNFETKYSVVSTVPFFVRGTSTFLISLLWTLNGFAVIGIISFMTLSWNMFVYDAKFKMHKEKGWHS